MFVEGGYVNAYSALQLPGTFSRSTTVEPTCVDVCGSTFIGVPCAVEVQVQRDLTFIEPRPARVLLEFIVEGSVEFPNAGRLELPEHERMISAESLAALRQGVADSAAGRVVRVSAKDLGLDQDEP
jgi:hypothetical protein